MNQSDAEQYVDVIGVTMADSGDIKIEGELLHSYVEGEHPTGIKTLAWTDSVFVVAGTEGDESRVTVGQELTPATARELAATLRAAADESEAKSERYSDNAAKDEKHLLRSVMEWVRQ